MQLWYHCWISFFILYEMVKCQLFDKLSQSMSFDIHKYIFWFLIQEIQSVDLTQIEHSHPMWWRIECLNVCMYLLSIFTNLIKFTHSEILFANVLTVGIESFAILFNEKEKKKKLFANGICVCVHQDINLLCELSVSLSLYFYLYTFSFMRKWIRKNTRKENGANERTVHNVYSIYTCTIIYISYSLLFAASFLIISFIVCIYIYISCLSLCVYAIWYIQISKCDSVINKSLACMYQSNDNNKNDNDDDGKNNNNTDVSTSMTSTKKFISLCRWIGTRCATVIPCVSIILMQSRHTNIDTKCIYCLLIRQCHKPNAMLFYRYAVQIGFI